jgi:hypothetical protein
VSKTVAGPVPTACVACGRRGGRQVAYGLVIGCGFCAAVEVYMAINIICLWVSLSWLVSIGCGRSLCFCLSRWGRGVQREEAGEAGLHGAV